MNFQKNADGSISLMGSRGWDKRITVDHALIEQADPRFLTVHGDVMTFRTREATVTYKIVSRDPVWKSVVATLVKVGS